MSSSSSSCTRNETALTSECNSLCFEGRPCVAYAVGAEAFCSDSSTFGNCTADDLCSYECFKNGPNDFVDNEAVDFTTYTFLIPFGVDAKPSEQEQSWTSDQEAAANAQLTATANLTDAFPSKSNDILQQIEPLSFLAATTHVILAGGSSIFGVRGKVARVQLPEELFASDSQLQAVTLANLGLEQILKSSLPSGLVNLTISNCLMSSYPDDLQTMDTLKSLDLSKNYYAYFPTELSLPTLQTLNLSANSLTSFEGALPSLLTLDLSDNNLASVPTTVFDMANLHQLDLHGNNFTNVELNTAQYEFMQALDVLQVDSFGELTCNTSSQQQMAAGTGTVTVCVSDTGTTGKEASSNSDTALIAGVTAAALVLIIIIVIIVVFRCLRRRAQYPPSGPEIISLNRDLSSPMVNPPYRAPADKGRCTSDTDVDAPSPQLAFPYDEQLGPLCVNSADLEYIRRLSEEGAGLGPNQHHRVTYLTKYRGARFLVCKRLQHEVIDEALDTHRFALDVKLAATLDHPRIVALVGVVWSRMYGLEALYEYMEGGNLRSYLADLDAREELRSWTSPTSWKVQIALDVTEALVYAHSFSPTLVHRDLTSRSVLLSSPPEPRARLDDFIVPSQASRGSSGMSTIGLSLREERWLAPEVITGSADYSSAGDVYALGVILSELDTHSLPYEDLQDGAMGTQSMTDVAILDLVGSGKLRPTFSLGCPVEVQQLAQLCLSFEASERPTAVQVVLALRALLVDQPRSSYVI